MYIIRKTVFYPSMGKPCSVGSVVKLEHQHFICNFNIIDYFLWLGTTNIDKIQYAQLIQGEIYWFKRICNTNISVINDLSLQILKK